MKKAKGSRRASEEGWSLVYSASTIDGAIGEGKKVTWKIGTTVYKVVDSGKEIEFITRNINL
jgi:hypothetical protein